MSLKYGKKQTGPKRKTVQKQNLGQQNWAKAFHRPKNLPKQRKGEGEFMSDLSHSYPSTLSLLYLGSVRDPSPFPARFSLPLFLFCSSTLHAPWWWSTKLHPGPSPSRPFADRYAPKNHPCDVEPSPLKSDFSLRSTPTL